MSIFFWHNNSKRLTCMIGKTMALFRYKMCNYLTLMEDLSCGHCHMFALCAECVCLGVFKREAEACHEWWKQVQGTKKTCNQRPQLQDEICWRERVDVYVLLLLSSSGEMGKNKQKGKKNKTVFQVANKHLKHKNKAKPVTTTLKHVCAVLIMSPILFYFNELVVVATLMSFLSPQINAVKNEKVENLNQIFTQVQRDVKSISKSVAPQPKKQTQVKLRSHAVHSVFKSVIQAFSSF